VRTLMFVAMFAGPALILFVTAMAGAPILLAVDAARNLRKLCVLGGSQTQ
jgi:hypothetical protein